jgi:hypothetical protein
MASPEHKRCLQCGYILDGLPQPRCPECGRFFTADDKLSYVSEPQSCVPLLIATAGAAVCQLGALLVGGLVRELWGLQLAAVLLAAGLVVHFWVVRTCLVLRNLPAAAVKHRLWGLLAGAVSALLLLGGCSIGCNAFIAALL